MKKYPGTDVKSSRVWLPISVASLRVQADCNVALSEQVKLKRVAQAWLGRLLKKLLSTRGRRCVVYGLLMLIISSSTREKSRSKRLLSR
jgi:hypothetical protein